MGKMSSTAREKLRDLVPDEPFEAIFEIKGPEFPLPARSDRAARIAACEKQFEELILPIEAAIEEAGGEVLGRAWLNRSLKVRLPREAVVALSKRADVKLVDTPRMLRAD